MDDSLNVNKAAGAPSALNVGLGIPTREQLIWALCEVMDGMSWYDLKADTGLSQGECEKLLEIRNSVHQQWVGSGMKMPNVESELNAGLGMKEQTTLEKFYKFSGDEEPDPLERLRFFCSLVMKGQDWLDVEQFFDDVKTMIPNAENAALTPNDGA